MIEACFVHSWGFVWGNLSMKTRELTTSWCSIPLSVGLYAFVDHGGLPLWAARNRSCSSLCTAAVRYTINYRLFTMTCMYLHSNVCCCLFTLLPVLRMIFKWASWELFLVAALAASWWTHKCLHSCCVPMSDILDVSPANRLDFDSLPAGWGGCASLICFYGIGEEDYNEKKWEVLRTI